MINTRQQWADFICAIGNAGRYLLPGSNLELTDDSSAEDLDLRSFFSKLRDSGASARLLGAAYALSQPVILAFLEDDLPGLLKSLGHSTTTAPAQLDHAAKGRIVWQSTLKGRLSGKVPRGSFITKRAERSADIPENQLVKWFLMRLAAVSRQLQNMGAGALPQRLTRIRQLALKGLDNVYLKGVSDPASLSARMVQTSMRNRDRRYGTAAILARMFRDSAIQGKWAAIIQLLENGWLAPVTTEDLYELFSLVLVLDILEKELEFGEPVTVGLIQRGRRSVAEFKQAEEKGTASVYFDQVPSSVTDSSSQYLELLKLYDGVSAQERRPDMLVLFEKASTKRVLLIEVKETIDPSYLRDSVYKVMGYMSDFRSLWPVEQRPKSLLLVPTGVEPADSSYLNQDLVMVSTDMRSKLVTALAACT